MAAVDPQLVLLAPPEGTPAIELRINFGSSPCNDPAELDRLAEWLLR
jgi:hypothetical protein